MSGTRHEVEELRDGEEEVEDLWYEEEQHRLAEVTEDSNNSERHPGKVAERVTNEHSCRIPDVSDTKQSTCAEYSYKHSVDQ